MTAPTSPSSDLLGFHFQNTATFFQTWIQEGRVPNVVLFTGPSGIGKRTFARHFATILLCEKKTGCGLCSKCLKSQNNTWTQFSEIGVDADTHTYVDKIKVEDLRDLKRQQGFGAEENSFRFFLIPRAERMTPQAANSVLKIFEEPPKGWVFLLTTRDVGLLLPTIVSRACTLRLKPLPPPILDSIVGQLAPPGAQGSISRARMLLQPDALELEKKIQSLNPKHPRVHQTVSELIDFGAKGDSQYDLLLDLLETRIRDQLLTSVAPQQPWIQSFEHLAHLRKAEKVALNTKIQLQSLFTPFF